MFRQGEWKGYCSYKCGRLALPHFSLSLSLSLPYFSFAVYDRLPFTVHRPFWTNDGRKSPVFTVFGNPVMRSQADIYLTEQDLLLMCDPIAGTSPTASSPQCSPVRERRKEHDLKSASPKLCYAKSPK